MRYFKKNLFLITLIIFGFNSELKSQTGLVSFNSSECLEEDVYERNYINRILATTINPDYHLYEIFVVTNCSWASQGKIELKKDTLNLIYSGTPILKDTSEEVIEVFTEINGFDTLTIETSTVIEEIWESEVSECDCAFNLKYKIKGLKNRNYVVTANDELISKTAHKYKIVNEKPKFEVIEKDTINLFDIYGLKQGIHIKKRDNTIFSKYQFIDGKRIKGYHVYYNFKEYKDNDTYEKFGMVETYMENGKYSKRKYFNDGNLVKECNTDGSFDEGTNCKYFN